MTGIYRSPDGRDEVQQFCRTALDRSELDLATETVPTDLGPTHVVRTGRGAPLVLLPGTNFATAVWLDLVAALARTHEVLAVDLPGQPGLSSAERPRHARAYGPWLAGLVRALTDAPPVVVGHSLGGRVALLGLSDGLEASGVLLVDPAGFMRLRVGAGVLRATLPWMRSPSPASSEALLQAMMAPTNRPDAQLVEWMSLVGQAVRTSLAPPPLSRAAFVRLGDVPITVVSGDHDAFLPVTSLRRAVARHRPATRFVTALNAGHLLPHERPELLVEIVAQLG